MLCRVLPQGEPKRETVAQALHLSQRTLQRRLQEEGTSFQTLLDDTRRELAEQYLAQPSMTLLETAYLLGFADPSNFFRAFRRWFDATPGEYRTRMGPSAVAPSCAEGDEASVSDARTPAYTAPAP
ncbi:HTH-type transcriptional regulator VirS [compost metagenome]